MPIIVVADPPPAPGPTPNTNALLAGVESVFTYNDLTLNDRSVDNKYRIDQINGLHSADLRDARENKTARDGEIPLNAFYSGRTITLGGRIEVLTGRIVALREMETALAGAFAQLEEKTLYISQGALGGWDTQIDCRMSQPIAMTDEVKDWYHRRDFLVTLRASDPRIVSQQEETDVWTATATSVSGETTHVSTNQGNYMADLIITLSGPMTDPTIQIGNSYFAFLGGTTIGTGQEWTINTKDGTVTDLTGISRFQNVVLNSVMPRYLSGINSLQFGATGLSVGTSKVTVKYRHSWL